MDHIYDSYLGDGVIISLSFDLTLNTNCCPKWTCTAGELNLR